MTADTLEKFALFFADPANWASKRRDASEDDACPDHEGGIPKAALEFCHVVGVSAPAGAPSPDKAAENINQTSPSASSPATQGNGSSPEAGAPVNCSPAPGELFSGQGEAA